MKIGIISDTHDDIENVRKAIDIFNGGGAVRDTCRRLRLPGCCIRI